MGRILAVDPGDVRIGLAISDPTGTIARPLTVIEHVSRDHDADRILAVAEEHQVESILVGVPLDDSGDIGPQARKSLRLIEALRSNADRRVLSWDESASTLKARSIRASSELLDARAAAVFLQEYLDVQAA